MLPFMFNIYKMNISLSDEQISLSEWAMKQLREGMLIFVLKGLQESLSDKEEGQKSHESSIIISQFEECKNDKLCSFLDNAPLDTSDKDYYINVGTGSAMSDYLRTQGDNSKLSQNNKENVKLIELAPKMFKQVRKLYNVTSKEISDSFNVKKYREGQMFVDICTSSKGEESLIIHPNDSQLVLKSMPENEYTNLKDNVAKYYNHIKQHPDNLLFPILGVFSLYFPWHLCIAPIHFCISKTNLKPRAPGQIWFILSVYFIEFIYSKYRRTMKKLQVNIKR